MRFPILPQSEASRLVCAQFSGNRPNVEESGNACLFIAHTRTIRPLGCPGWTTLHYYYLGSPLVHSQRRPRPGDLRSHAGGSGLRRAHGLRHRHPQRPRRQRAVWGACLGHVSGAARCFSSGFVVFFSGGAQAEGSVLSRWGDPVGDPAFWCGFGAG